ncbi:ABC transporter substrate-binding protein [Chelatococcus sp. SYSU_G07232]|uniref:ABC transporter substrate-binding protein n=1 Tax=Chelatococcus albus TaxID=3047466 RepID=A0ABT7AIN6_9HYPH|nr:ABC transporter substrate-binding protein [Chelatococcus sp. SYSU_G07232]MDJ1159243.1 ABC transporter substrate-binding protein [Chelatococcus sp. SYSU_G07232]
MTLFTCVRRVLGAAVVTFGTLAGVALPAAAQEKVSVAVLRFVSSGGLFLAVEKGYFKEEGLEVELKFFEAAQPIALAVVSGDADFGVTAFTAGFYNLAGKGALKVIAAQAKEAKGYEGNLVLASNTAFDKGLTGLEKLSGRSVGITQVGSSFHYQLGQIAGAKGFDLKSIDMKPLQSLPNMVASIKSGQVDAIIIAPHLAKPLVAAGEAKLIGRVSDIAEYQFGGLFTNTKTIVAKRATVERFVRAYQKGAADYAAAFLKRDGAGNPVYTPGSDAAAALVGKHVYPSDAAEQAAPKVKASAFYADPQARLDVADIVAQVAWLKAQGLVDASVDAKGFLDLSFVQGHLNAN